MISRLGISIIFAYWACGAFAAIFLHYALKDIWKFNLQIALSVWEFNFPLGITTLLNAIAYLILITFVGNLVFKSFSKIKLPKSNSKEVSLESLEFDPTPYLKTLKPTEQEQPQISSEQLYKEWMHYRLLPLAIAILLITGGLL